MILPGGVLTIRNCIKILLRFRNYKFIFFVICSLLVKGLFFRVRLKNIIFK